MPSRGFSLLAGMISVATLSAVLLAPFPLNRARLGMAHAGYTAFSQGLDEASDHLSLGYLARLAQRRLARHRQAAQTESLVRPLAAPPRATQWQSLARGVSYRAVNLVAASGESMRVLQVRLDPHLATLRVLHGGDAKPVASVAEARQALAAVNGSYFDTDRRPLGYLKIDGRVLNSAVASGAAFTGVFTMTHGVARIVPRASFDGHVVDTALQAGPRLVADGAPTSGLRETRSFRQTGIAVTRGGDIVLYATDGSYRGMTWAEMQGLLSGPAKAGGVDPRDVLNLDGGSSSQMFVRLGAGRDVSTGFPTPVPVVVAMFGR